MSILEHGLDPDRMDENYRDEERQNYVFLTEDDSVADLWDCDTVLLEITLPEEQEERLVIDEGEFTRCPFLIRAEFIKEVSRGTV